MGTRFEHLSVNRIIFIGKEIMKISEQLEISFSDALNLYLAVAKIDDYDEKDEQLAGLGELIKELIKVQPPIDYRTYLDIIKSTD